MWWQLLSAAALTTLPTKVHGLGKADAWATVGNGICLDAQHDRFNYLSKEVSDLDECAVACETLDNDRCLSIIFWSTLRLCNMNVDAVSAVSLLGWSFNQVGHGQHPVYSYVPQTDALCLSRVMCDAAIDCVPTATTAAVFNPTTSTCTCICKDGFTGATCSDCQPTFRRVEGQCIACTIAADCFNRASSVKGDGSLCVCVCIDQWSGSNCDSCPLIYNQQTCSSCASGRISYPTCTQCTSLLHCNGRAVQVTPNSDHTTCVCTCSADRIGATCDKCAPLTYGGIPKCEMCEPKHCSYNGDLVSKDSGPYCECACHGMWTGTHVPQSAMGCSVCPGPYDHDTCNDCKIGRINYPVCTACVSLQDLRCLVVHGVPAVTSDQNRTRCICSQCPNQWIGVSCDECPMPFGGADCNTCSSGFVGYPSCRECNVASDCSSHAVDVAASTDSLSCLCKCRNFWSGPTCDFCPASYSIDEDCSRCVQNAVDFPVCRPCDVGTDCTSGARTVTAIQGSCICECANYWSGQKCDVCPEGFDAELDCQCISTATKLCYVQNATCQCECVAQWKGSACSSCRAELNQTSCDSCAANRVNYPECIACSLEVHCSGHALRSWEDGGTCRCECTDSWVGAACGVCPDRYVQTTCAACAPDHENYPTCSLKYTCSVSTDCSSHARSVATLPSGCLCECEHQWIGPNCSVCPEVYDGPDCDKCEVGRIQYPSCVECTNETHCSGHAEHIVAEMESCVCTCGGMWQGSACAICDVIYNVDCNACAHGRAFFPACTLCSDDVHCNGHGAAAVVDDVCMCRCRDMWSGGDCDVCDERYTDTCDACASGVDYPTCVECSNTTHCNDHAVSVERDSANMSCVCSCANHWTGELCDACPEPYGGVHCNRCTDGLVAYPHCSSCPLELCNGRAYAAFRDYTAPLTSEPEVACLCLCHDQWEGRNCETCKNIYNTECNNCAYGYIDYPECSACNTSTHCNARSVSVTSYDAKTCVCTCMNRWTADDCSLCPDSYSGSDCNICAGDRVDYPTCRLCTVEADCHGRALEVRAADGACVCLCRDFWTGAHCDTCEGNLDSTADCGMTTTFDNWWRAVVSLGKYVSPDEVNITTLAEDLNASGFGVVLEDSCVVPQAAADTSLLDPCDTSRFAQLLSVPCPLCGVAMWVLGIAAPINMTHDDVVHALPMIIEFLSLSFDAHDVQITLSPEPTFIPKCKEGYAWCNGACIVTSDYCSQPWGEFHQTATGTCSCKCVDDVTGTRCDELESGQTLDLVSGPVAKVPSPIIVRALVGTEWKCPGCISCLVGPDEWKGHSISLLLFECIVPNTSLTLGIQKVSVKVCHPSAHGGCLVFPKDPPSVVLLDVHQPVLRIVSLDGYIVTCGQILRNISASVTNWTITALAHYGFTNIDLTIRKVTVVTPVAQYNAFPSPVMPNTFYATVPMTLSGRQTVDLNLATEHGDLMQCSFMLEVNPGPVNGLQRMETTHNTDSLTTAFTLVDKWGNTVLGSCNAWVEKCTDTCTKWVLLNTTAIKGVCTLTARYPAPSAAVYNVVVAAMGVHTSFGLPLRLCSDTLLYDADSGCVECPRGLVCNGSTETSVQQGWWREGTDMPEQCYFRERCLGIDPFCTESTQGPLCGECAGDHRSALGGHCLQCPSLVVAALCVLAAVAVYVALLLASAYYSSIVLNIIFLLLNVGFLVPPLMLLYPSYHNLAPRVGDEAELLYLISIGGMSHFAMCLLPSDFSRHKMIDITCVLVCAGVVYCLACGVLWLYQPRRVASPKRDLGFDCITDNTEHAESMIAGALAVMIVAKARDDKHKREILLISANHVLVVPIIWIFADRLGPCRTVRKISVLEHRTETPCFDYSMPVALSVLTVLCCVICLTCTRHTNTSSIWSKHAPAWWQCVASFRTALVSLAAARRLTSWCLAFLLGYLLLLVTARPYGTAQASLLLYALDVTSAAAIVLLYASKDDVVTYLLPSLLLYCALHGVHEAAGFLWKSTDMRCIVDPPDPNRCVHSQRSQVQPSSEQSEEPGTERPVATCSSAVHRPFYLATHSVAEAQQVEISDFHAGCSLADVAEIASQVCLLEVSTRTQDERSVGFVVNPTRTAAFVIHSYKPKPRKAGDWSLYLWSVDEMASQKLLGFLHRTANPLTAPGNP